MSDVSVPSPVRIRFILIYWLYVALLAVPTAAWLVAVSVWAPPFKDIFRDFKTTLPTSTELLFRLQYALESPLSWVLIAAAVFAAAVPLALLTARRRTPTGQAAAFIAVTLALTIVGFAVIDLSLTALVAPLLRIMHSVSGGGGE
jgi:hypothetical protein